MKILRILEESWWAMEDPTEADIIQFILQFRWSARHLIGMFRILARSLTNPLANATADSVSILKKSTNAP
jgi:hypothetical protein